MTYHARELLRIPNFEGEEESWTAENNFLKNNLFLFQFHNNHTSNNFFDISFSRFKREKQIS